MHLFLVIRMLHMSNRFLRKPETILSYESICTLEPVTGIKRNPLRKDFTSLFPSSLFPSRVRFYMHHIRSTIGIFVVGFVFDTGSSVAQASLELHVSLEITPVSSLGIVGMHCCTWLWNVRCNHFQTHTVLIGWLDSFAK